jgi:pimeloyl-ACP methyl ester carboxylesterase
MLVIVRTYVRPAGYSPRVHVRRVARLMRWLGPWTSDGARPRGIRRRRVVVDGRFDAWVYRPRVEPEGAMLLVPGLHEFRALRVGRSLGSDCARSFDALLALPDVPRGAKPGVFSISFGAFPAIQLAASSEYRDRIRALTLFGGYASFEEAIRFSLEGDGTRPNDPLNRPVVFLNLLSFLDRVPSDPEPLRRAWITYVRTTWGRPEMKARERYEPIAREIAAALPADARELFLMGTGVIEGGPERIRNALVRAHGSFAHLDPLPACADVRAKVSIVHGRDDDVIPYTHAEVLGRALPSSQVLLTGLYAHSAQGVLDPRALAGEVHTLGRILGAIASTFAD